MNTSTSGKKGSPQERRAGSAGIQPVLAVVIACRCFEIQVRKLADEYHLEGIDSNMPLEEVIEAFPNFGAVDPLRMALWQSLRKIRNDLFHEGRMPGPRETRLLIDEVGRLEFCLDSGI